MNDRELEARLRAWYGDEFGADETAPGSLRRDVAAIPRTAPNRSRRFGRGPTLLAAAALLLVGGALAAGSGLVRQLSLLPPEPAPSLAADATPSPANESPRPTAVTSPAPPEAPSPVPGPAGVWIPTGSMGTSRSGHTAVRLLDGRVLVVGGYSGDEPDLVMISAELYDPESGTWSATGNMLRPHAGFQATLLRDGRVLVGDIEDPAADNPVTGAEVYDPETGTWSETGKMVRGASADTSATLLRDGRVLVAAGDRAELYDPDRGTWTATGEMISGPIGRDAPVLLLDGRVLVTGGFGDGTLYAGDSAELYDPDTGTWSATGSMGTPRFGHVALRLLDGRVLVVGGGFDDGNDTSAELYDPDGGAWSATGSMLKPHGATFSGISATVLRDGTVLVVGGDGAELYDPESGTWTITGSMLQGRDAPVLLLDGTVLVAGGETSSAELYVPAGVSPPPAVAALPTPTPTPIPTPSPSPSPSPTPVPPQAGPVPPGARTWKVTVVNDSSRPATLFVAEEDSTGMTRLVGSVTPNVVSAGVTVEVTFRLPAKGANGFGIFVNPGPANGALLSSTDVPLPGEIRITADGQVGWLSP